MRALISVSDKTGVVEFARGLREAFEYLGSDPEELEARVHAVEHPLYVETVAKLVAEQ